MLNNKTFLALIPARAGSKRLPKKNILNLATKPLISWTLEAAKKSKYIDEIVVSSDCDDVLKIAQKYNVEVVSRPKDLASDTASSFDVAKHVLEKFGFYDYLLLLQPTSPLRKSEHIDEAVELLFEKKASAIVSVSETADNPLWSNTLPIDSDMSNFIKKDMKNKRSQDLEKYYKLNGAIYIVKISDFLKEGTFLISKNIFAYIMDIKSSIDIDNEFDFKIANMLLLEK